MSHAAAWLPPAREITRALAHTTLLLRLRWRMLRTTTSRALVWGGPALIVAVVLLSSQAGSATRNIAETGYDTAAGQFAVNYLVALQRGDLGAVAALAFAAAVAASIFSPFTGSTNVALAAPDDLAIIRPARLHRYFDSLGLHFLSTIGMLQVIILTAVASMVTLQGNRPIGLALTWFTWVLLTVLAVTEGWVIEYLHRRYGKNTRRLIGVGLGAVLGLLLLIDPQHGRTLFGLGNVYMRMLAPDQSAWTYAGYAAAIAAASAALLGVGLVFCWRALARPAPVPTSRAKDRGTRALSTRPTVAAYQFVWRQMWRTAEVRRPIATILLIGVPAVWVSQGSETAMTTLVIAAPLAVALAWSVNVYGVLGPGMTWLAAQPRAMARLPLIGTAVGAVSVALITALCFVPPLAGGMVNLRDAVSVAAGVAVATAITQRSAAAKSIHHPYLARLGQRGDVVVPPLTAVNYTLRFVLWGGQIGVITMTQSDALLQFCLVAGFLTVAALRYWQLMRTWGDRREQARVVAVVAD